MSNLKSIWTSIITWWVKWTAGWRKPVSPVPEVPALPEFEVVAIEPDVIVLAIPIDVEFIESEVVEPPQASELQVVMSQFLMLLTERELRAHQHYSMTGSCNVDVPRLDCRVTRPIDSRVCKTRNSRAAR